MGGPVRLNSDGAVSQVHNGQVRTAGCGGLLRGEGGNWLCGYYKFIWHCNPFVAELWGVLEGLKFAKLRGFQAVEAVADLEILNCGDNTYNYKLVALKI